MPIHGYPGNVITANPTAPTVSSASGVWTTEQQLQAMAAGNWPMAATQISRSLRFNSADSAYLNRTPASAGNLQTWTWSGWVKRSRLGVDSETIFALFDYLASPTTNKQHGIRFLSGDTIEYWCYQNPSYNGQKITTQVFRDVSSWYHIVAVWDTPNATAANRMRLYVNGSEVTTFGTNTNPTQNSNGEINRAFLHTIGTFYDPDYGSPTNNFNGYLTEVNFIDGQALTPASFGQTNSSTGVWEPRQYTGPYGTNGFYLNFSDNSGTTSTTLGKDYSGNGNNWTPNNFSVTAGVGNDSMVDSPTAYGTDTGVGGTVRGNYCTLNPLDEPSTYAAFGSSANGNLDFSVSNDAAMGATFAVSSGKWYWEMTVVSGHSAGANTVWAAIASSTPSSVNKLPYQSGSGGRSYATTGLKYNENTSSSYGNTYTNGDVIGCALDLDNGKVYWSKNGTFQASGDPVAGTNAAFTGLTGTWLPVASSNAPLTSFNFGQRPFAYTAPSGFKALCTTNLPTPTIGATSTTLAGNYFNANLWTGTGASNAITGVGFSPDFVWIKKRSGIDNHNLYDTNRGANQRLISNSSNAENTETQALMSFDSNGFTLGTDGGVNQSGQTYVGWSWRGSDSSAVTNTAGTITSTVSASTTSGFSIVTATAPSAAAQGTVGHGLGVTPSMIIVKTRSTTYNWSVYHASVCDTTSKYLRLNDTSALLTFSTVWGASLPTSSVFGITGDGAGAPSGTFVAYCFAPVAGYSAFGSYTGNGSADGPFVYLGFRPEFVMIKRTSAADNWVILDAVRSTANPTDEYLWANLSNAEVANLHAFDFLSNGFKIRNSTSDHNTNGSTYIYACFAESPFKYALAR